MKFLLKTCLATTSHYIAIATHYSLTFNNTRDNCLQSEFYGIR